MTTEMRDRIALLVGFIWEAARKPGPDLTGLGRVRICEQNVEQLVRDVVIAERERCAKVAEDCHGTLVGHANHGYGGGAEQLALDIADAIRKGE